MPTLAPRPRTAPLAKATWLVAFAAACGAGASDQGVVGNDPNPPLAGTVADGPGNDVDSSISTRVLQANWSGFRDGEGAIDHYEVAIGTAPGGNDTLAWTAVGSTTAAAFGSLALTVGTTYFVAVRAVDQAGHVSPPSTSDGVRVTGGVAGPSTARSLVQWGITWTFAQQHVVGEFANGDFWVAGPIDVVEIVPHCAVVQGRTVHGSMLNPRADGVQGYDSALYDAFARERYDPALNRALGIGPLTPLHVPVASSLVSTISQLTAPANGSLSQLRAAAVLTVLAQDPGPDAFRPAYAGNDKTIRHWAVQLDFATLAMLPTVGQAPSLATTTAAFARAWLDHCPGWLSRYLHPVENMPDYSRDFTALVGTAALLLQLDFTPEQKRPLLVRLVQLGIDNFGNVQDGCRWPGTGGQCSGRKFPILFAGQVLHDSAMRAVGTTHGTVFLGPNDAQNRTTFGEDSQTFFVQQTAPGIFNWGYGNYASQHVGMAEWGNGHAPMPWLDDANWSGDPYRRCCTANAWVGQALALRIMGLQQAWQHAPFFDYLDRYMVTEPAGSWTLAWTRWHETMWTTYRSQF